MILRKLGCQKQKNQLIAGPGIKLCDQCILPLLLETQTMQFSLDCKQRRHKQNQCSAADSYASDYDSVASENQPLLNR